MSQDVHFDYQIGQDAVVFDVGGFKGDFTAWIREAYKCPVHCWEPIFVRDLKERFKDDPLVWIYDSALDVENKEGEIWVNGDSTSIYHETGGATKQRIKIRDIMTFIHSQALPHIDLLKLNCEGSEWNILKKMKEQFYLYNVKNIICQWHPHGSEGIDLSDTHYIKNDSIHWKWYIRK